MSSENQPSNIIPFKKLPDPDNEDTGGYVASHWAQAIRILDSNDKVLFECEMMCIYKEDFPMATDMLEKIAAAINGISQ